MENRHKFSDVDFSKHKLSINVEDLCTEYRLTSPESKVHYLVVWKVLKDCTVVTGDYGSYIFRKPIEPHKESMVLASHFIEYLSHGERHGLNSVTNKVDTSHLLDSWKTVIKDYKEEHLLNTENKSLSENDFEMIRDTVKSLIEEGGTLNECYNTLFNYFQSLESFSNIHRESLEYLSEYLFEVGFQYEIPTHLRIVFDAFNEICNQL